MGTFIRYEMSITKRPLSFSFNIMSLTGVLNTVKYVFVALANI